MKMIRIVSLQEKYSKDHSEELRIKIESNETQIKENSCKEEETIIKNLDLVKTN